MRCLIRKDRIHIRNQYKNGVEDRLENRPLYSIPVTVIILLLIAFFPAGTKAEEPVRSSSLREAVTQDGETLRIDYVNEQGTVTYAADKRCATIIITGGDDSRTETFYDADGNPARQQMGHYAIRREYDEEGRNRKIIFLGIDREPILNSNGYASVIRTFDDRGNIVTEHYYDEQGEPVRTNSFGYGCYKEYDGRNRNVLLAYLGNDDKPTVTAQGFAIAFRVYYEEENLEGFIKEEYYFDQDHQPAILQNGQSAVRREYDRFGRTAVTTFLDAAGNPIVTKEGYTTVRKTYYEDDSTESEMYYDMDGAPARLAEGQYGIRYRDGKLIYLDQDGRELFNIRRTLYNYPVTILIFVLTAVIASACAGRKANLLFLGLCLSAIAYMTLLYRTGADSGFYKILLSSAIKPGIRIALTRGMIYNILLFVPLGTILYRVNPAKPVLLVPVAISVLIELVQYILRIGLPEVTDIICNSLGGLLGYYAGYGLTKLISLLRIRLQSR